MIRVDSQKNKNPSIDRLIEKFASNISIQKDSAWIYIDEAEKRSIKGHNDYYRSRCIYNKGVFYFTYGDMQKAKKMLKSALQIAQKAENNRIIVRSYTQLAEIEMNIGNFANASDLLVKGLRFSRLKKMPEEAMLLNSLGMVYLKQKDTISSVKTFKEAEKILIQMEPKDPLQLLQVYNNLGIYEKSTDITKSLDYLKKALNIAYQLDDKNSQYDELINISNLYIKNNIYESAFKYLVEAKKIALELNDKTKIYYVYYNFAYYYKANNNFRESLKMYQLALENSQNKDFEQKLGIYQDISIAYEKINNAKEALRYNKMYQQLKDSIFTIEKNKNFNEIITKYEVEKKNDQILLLNQQKEIEKKRKNNILITSCFMFLILLGFVLFIYKKGQFQKKLRVQEERNHQQEKVKLIKDQELKEAKALISGQNEERNRIAKDLHDGVAGNLAGIKFILNQENKNIKNENLDYIQNELSLVFQEIRTISHNLSQNYIQNKTLKTLLQDLQIYYHGKAMFHLSINIFPENATDDLNDTKKQHLYRIFQELLQNVLKHSKATEVELSINRTENLLHIIFEDNGIGFSIENLKGIGIKNIEERLKVMDASLTIDNYAGKGSTFIIEMNI